MPKRKVNKKKSEEDNSKSSGEFEINLPWYVWALCVIIVVGLILWVVFSGMGKVNYKGLVFEIEKYGNTIAYHNVYYYNTPFKETIKYNLYIFNDPTKNDVPMNAEIVYPEYLDEIKLSINTNGLSECPESNRAVGMLSEFLTNNGFRIKIGTQNESMAKEYNMTYVTCETHPNDFVISLSSGNTTQVVQQGKSCFRIEETNCEIQKVVEKFIVESVAQAKARNK